jgi:hypothetical protein
VTAPAGRAAAGRAALLCVISAAGCYRAVPVPDPASHPGALVTVALSARGSEELAPVLGPGVARAEGVVRRGGADTLVVALARTETRDGRGARWTGETVAVPARHVTGVSRRALDRGRTWLLVAAVAGAVALGWGFGGGGLAGGDGGPVVAPPH